VETTYIHKLFSTYIDKLSKKAYEK